MNITTVKLIKHKLVHDTTEEKFSHCLLSFLDMSFSIVQRTFVVYRIRLVSLELSDLCLPLDRTFSKFTIAN